MAFGQQQGPPASSKDVHELIRLLQEAGHRDLRDARGPMGFTQRQAAGKFTREEVAVFIDQLESAAAGDDLAPVIEPPKPTLGAAASSALDHTLRRVPTEQLAAELQRRGWAVLEP